MLYLVHHGDAVGPDVDPQRPLSQAGRAHVEQLAETAARSGARPAVIWHSGKLRARQTAEAFLKTCNPLAEFSAVRGLQPTDPPQWAVDLVTGDARDIMLVGHMPHLPRLYAQLVAVPTSDPPPEFPLHGIVALEFVTDCWQEIWRI